VELLKSNDENLCFYAVSAFSRLLKHCYQCHKKCAETELFDNLLALIEPNISLELLSGVTALLPVLVDFSILNKQQLSNERVKQILTVIDSQIDNPNDPIVLDLIQLTTGLAKNKSVDLINESEVMPKITELLLHENQQIQENSICLLGLISEYYLSNDKQLSADMFNEEIFKKISQFLNSDSFEFKRCSLRVLAIILFENNEQIQTLIDTNIIEALIDVINNSKDDNKVFGIRTIGVIISVCGEEQLSYMYSKGLPKDL
jgi:hypothetical protein